MFCSRCGHEVSDSVDSSSDVYDARPRSYTIKKVAYFAEIVGELRMREYH